MGISLCAFAAEPLTSRSAPKGLTSSDWSSIRTASEAGRHACHRQVNGNLTARNPGQQWSTEFDGKNFTAAPDHGQWTWGLELTAYVDRVLASASLSMIHEGVNITCHRDENITECFIYKNFILANALRADCLIIQNAARFQYPAGTDAAGNARNVSERAHFLLAEFPPRDRSQPDGGTQGGNPLPAPQGAATFLSPLVCFTPSPPK